MIGSECDYSFKYICYYSLFENISNLNHETNVKTTTFSYRLTTRENIVSTTYNNIDESSLSSISKTKNFDLFNFLTCLFFEICLTSFIFYCFKKCKELIQ